MRVWSRGHKCPFHNQYIICILVWRYNKVFYCQPSGKVLCVCEAEVEEVIGSLLVLHSSILNRIQKSKVKFEAIFSFSGSYSHVLEGLRPQQACGSWSMGISFSSKCPFTVFFLFISHSSFEMQPRCPLLQEAFHLTQRKGFLSQWAVLLGSYLLHSRAIAIHCEPMGKQWLRLTLSLAGGHVFFTQACIRYLVCCPRVNTRRVKSKQQQRRLFMCLPFSRTSVFISGMWVLPGE